MKTVAFLAGVALAKAVAQESVEPVDWLGICVDSGTVAELCPNEESKAEVFTCLGLALKDELTNTETEDDLESVFAPECLEALIRRAEQARQAQEEVITQQKIDWMGICTESGDMARFCADAEGKSEVFSCLGAKIAKSPKKKKKKKSTDENLSMEPTPSPTMQPTHSPTAADTVLTPICATALKARSKQSKEEMEKYPPTEWVEACRADTTVVGCDTVADEAPEGSDPALLTLQCLAKSIQDGQILSEDCRDGIVDVAKWLKKQQENMQKLVETQQTASTPPAASSDSSDWRVACAENRDIEKFCSTAGEAPACLMKEMDFVSNECHSALMKLTETAPVQPPPPPIKSKPNNGPSAPAATLLSVSTAACKKGKAGMACRKVAGKCPKGKAGAACRRGSLKTAAKAKGKRIKGKGKGKKGKAQG